MATKFERSSVALYSPSGQYHNTPPDLHGEGSFPEARLVAYDGCIWWGPQPPVIGHIMSLRVHAPFCCTQGQSFWACYGEKLLVRGRLMAISQMDRLHAQILVRIVDIRSASDYIQPTQTLPDAYPPLQLPGDHGYWVRKCGEDYFELENSFGDDFIYSSYIYMAPDGTDHLLMSRFTSPEGTRVYVGDKLLGQRSQSPYRWTKEGLLIDDSTKIILVCRTQAKELTIPDEIRSLGRFSFQNHCPNLQLLHVPRHLTLRRQALNPDIGCCTK